MNPKYDHLNSEHQHLLGRLRDWRQRLTGVPQFAPGGMEFSPAFEVTREIDAYLKTNGTTVMSTMPWPHDDMGREVESPEDSLGVRGDRGCCSGGF